MKKAKKYRYVIVSEDENNREFEDLDLAMMYVYQCLHTDPNATVTIVPLTIEDYNGKKKL